MFTKVERLISSRNLRPKRKEGFLKIISIFSFVGIMLGVAILIIVMSVMNGFKTDLTNKILGLNPHIVVQPNSFIIDNDYVTKIKENFKEASISKTYSGEGIIIINDKAKGIIFKKPSFFLGLRFLDAINLSIFVNNFLFFKFRFNIF